MASHHRSLSEPFSVAQLTHQEPPPPLPQHHEHHEHQDHEELQDAADIGNAQKRPSSAFAKKTEAEKKKPFKCDRGNCGMAFSRQEHLLRHIRKHTGEKPFHCRVCGNSFSRLDNLRQHSQCHERKRRIRNSRRITNVRAEDVQPVEQPQVYPTPTQQASILSPMPTSSIQPIAAIAQDIRPIRRRPDPIVLPHETQFPGQREMNTPPESPASQYGNAPPSPSPYSPYTNSISSIASTPTTGSFMPSPDNRSGYNTPYNRYSWSFLDSVSSNFAATPAEARTPKNSRRQTLMAPPSIASLFSETPSEASQPPTPREQPVYPTGLQSPRQNPAGLQSPRGEGSWFGNNRPKTWHGGPPMMSTPPPQSQVTLPPVPPIRRDMVVAGRKRNSQVFDGDGINKATLEPDIMSASRSEADEQAVRALGFSLNILQPGNRSSLGLMQPGNRSSLASLAESTPTSRRYSNTFANGNVPNYGNGGPPPVSNGEGPSRSYYSTNGENPAIRPRYNSPNDGRSSRRTSAIYDNVMVTPNPSNEQVPRSIAEEGTRTPGLGGLCALVSAVELQNRE